MEYTTDDWAGNVSGTFEEQWRQGGGDSTPLAPVYYFQGDPYGSLAEFDAAKWAAIQSEEKPLPFTLAPGAGYGNIGGGGEDGEPVPSPAPAAINPMMLALIVMLVM